MARMAMKLALAIVVAASAAGAGAVYTAPYLARLFIEGYPPLVWTGSGHFAAVAGQSQPAPLPQASPNALLAGDLRAAFADTGGKALVIWKGGEIVLEHYASGLSADTKFNSYSMVKSLVGALVFKAVAERKLRLETPLGEIVPGIRDAGLAQVRIRALLTMTSGIGFEFGPDKSADEPSLKTVEDTHFNPFGPMARLHMMGLDAVLSDLRLDGAARGRFSYQNVNTAILGALIEAAYGKALPEVLSEILWRPAGAGKAFWRSPGPDRPVSAYCCLFAAARDWVRVGLYLARNGSPGAPFLPKPLWRAFLGLDIADEARRSGHYGYHIRQDILDRPGEPLQGGFSFLLGQGGQVLYLMPGRDFVVVRFGETMQLLHTTLYQAWRAAP